MSNKKLIADPGYGAHTVFLLPLGFLTVPASEIKLLFAPFQQNSWHWFIFTGNYNRSRWQRWPRLDPRYLQTREADVKQLWAGRTRQTLASPAVWDFLRLWCPLLCRRVTITFTTAAPSPGTRSLPEGAGLGSGVATRWSGILVLLCQSKSMSDF